MSNVLVVVDMQNDFIDGSLGTKEAQEIVPRVNKLIKEMRERGSQIIFTIDKHRNPYKECFEGKQGIPEHCIHNTEGCLIADNINVQPADEYIIKNSFGTFEIMDKIKVPTLIEICGLCTDICVITNALIIRTLFPNTKIVVYEDCCAGSTPEKHKAALEVLKSCLIEVKKFEN